MTKLSDVFSFGILVVEVQTGQAPWVGRPDGSFGPNPGFPSLPAWTPSAFRSLVARCLKVEAKERPSFDQILETLQVRKGFSGRI